MFEFILLCEDFFLYCLNKSWSPVKMQMFEKVEIKWIGYLFHAVCFSFSQAKLHGLGNETLKREKKNPTSTLQIYTRVFSVCFLLQTPKSYNWEPRFPKKVQPHWKKITKTHSTPPTSRCNSWPTCTITSQPSLHQLVAALPQMTM